jgi:hypothetical protein
MARNASDMELHGRRLHVPSPSRVGARRGVSGRETGSSENTTATVHAVRATVPARVPVGPALRVARRSGQEDHGVGADRAEGGASRFFSPLGGQRDDARPRDEYDALADLNVDPIVTARATRADALRRAVEDLESARGAAWAWNPARWQTHDGYVDYHTFLSALAAERRHRARMRLEAAAAHQLGQGGESVRSLLTATEREADD